MLRWFACGSAETLLEGATKRPIKLAFGGTAIEQTPDGDAIELTEQETRRPECCSLRIQGGVGCSPDTIELPEDAETDGDSELGLVTMSCGTLGSEQDRFKGSGTLSSREKETESGRGTETKSEVFEFVAEEMYIRRG